MRGLNFILFAIVLAGAPMWVLADEAKNEFGVGLSWLSVEGDDSGFPLDGDLDGPRVFFQHETQGGYTIDAWYASEDGEFTLTTGDETDYESSTFEVAVGKWFCVSDCALRVRPYIGINKFSSENELVAFGSTINVNQDRLKLPVGLEVSRSFGQWELSADLELGYKFDENQDIPALGVDQDAESEWSTRFAIGGRYHFPSNFFIEAKVSFANDDFDEKGGARSASEEVARTTLSVGRSF